MPVLLDENRMRDSSAENEAPLTEVVLRNCSMVYCFGWRIVWVDDCANGIHTTSRNATTVWVKGMTPPESPLSVTLFQLPVTRFQLDQFTSPNSCAFRLLSVPASGESPLPEIRQATREWRESGLNRVDFSGTRTALAEAGRFLP